MLHHMKLCPQPFAMIRDGYKTFELRLHDEKRKQIQIGDIICFTNLALPEERLEATVVGLHPYASFRELYASLPLEQCGYLPEEVAQASPADMEAYYPLERQSKYGVLAIELQLL